MRDGASKELIKKQLGDVANNQPNFVDLKTGQIKSKKAAKEKTPLQIAIADLKTLSNKLLDINTFQFETDVLYHSQWIVISPLKSIRVKSMVNDIPKCIADISTFRVRNSDELVPEMHLSPASWLFPAWTIHIFFEGDMISKT